MKKSEGDNNNIFINVLIAIIIVAVCVLLLYPWVKTIQSYNAFNEIDNAPSKKVIIAVTGSDEEYETIYR